MGIEMRPIKGNVAVYKDLNLEFVTKNSFCHARKWSISLNGQLSPCLGST